MGSHSRIEANRRNATMSTGRKTSEGKAASALNSLKHGLLSQDVLLPSEDGALWAEWGERLRAELNPVGELESVLVDRIIALIWRLGRLGKIEAGVLTWSYYRVLAERARAEAAKHSRTSLDLSDLVRVEVLDKAKHQQAVSKLHDFEAAQESNIATLGEAFVRDSREENAFAKLSRYETSLERSLFRAHHELQRLQAGRQGKHVPLPVAVDVDLSGIESRGNGSGPDGHL